MYKWVGGITPRFPLTTVFPEPVNKMTTPPSSWSRLRLDFINSMGEREKDGLDGDLNVAKYVPPSSQREYWTEAKIQELCSSCRVSADIPIIRESYIQVLSILVSISSDAYPMIHHIDTFISHRQDDTGLPWPPGQRRAIFDETQDPIFAEFLDKQWKFCPVTMDSGGSNRMSNRKLDRKQVLPVTRERSCGTHNSPRESELIKMDIHSEAKFTSQGSQLVVSVPILPLIAIFHNR